MTLTELQAFADAFADQVADNAVGIQEGFLALYGTYWQGMPTHQTPPADGEFVVCDWTTCPPTMPYGWSGTAAAETLMTNYPALPFQIQVDVYRRLEDHWWSGTMRFVWGGVTYEQTRVYDATGKLSQSEWIIVEELPE